MADPAFDVYTGTWGSPAAEASWRERNRTALEGCSRPGSRKHNPYSNMQEPKEST